LLTKYPHIGVESCTDPIVLGIFSLEVSAQKIKSLTDVLFAEKEGEGSDPVSMFFEK
jgi:hypothetical protein